MDIWLLKTADTAPGIDVCKCMGSGFRIHIHIHVKMGGTSELEGLFMQVGRECTQIVFAYFLKSRCIAEHAFLILRR